MAAKHPFCGSLCATVCLALLLPTHVVSYNLQLQTFIWALLSATAQTEEEEAKSNSLCHQQTRIFVPVMSLSHRLGVAVTTVSCWTLLLAAPLRLHVCWHWCVRLPVPLSACCLLFLVVGSTSCPCWGVWGHQCCWHSCWHSSRLAPSHMLTATNVPLPSDADTVPAGRKLCALMGCASSVREDYGVACKTIALLSLLSFF